MSRPGDVRNRNDCVSFWQRPVAVRRSGACGSSKPRAEILFFIASVCYEVLCGIWPVLKRAADGHPGASLAAVFVALPRSFVKSPDSGPLADTVSPGFTRFGSATRLAVGVAAGSGQVVGMPKCLWWGAAFVTITTCGNPSSAKLAKRKIDLEKSLTNWSRKRSLAAEAPPSDGRGQGRVD